MISIIVEDQQMITGRFYLFSKAISEREFFSYFI